MQNQFSVQPGSLALKGSIRRNDTKSKQVGSVLSSRLVEIHDTPSNRQRHSVHTRCSFPQDALICGTPRELRRGAEQGEMSVHIHPGYLHLPKKALPPGRTHGNFCPYTLILPMPRKWFPSIINQLSRSVFAFYDP